MSSGRILTLAIVATLCLATPAVIITILSIHFDMPYLRPLALAKEAVSDEVYETIKGKETSGHARIEVQIRWGRDWSGKLTPTRLREVITTTLDLHTELYHLEIEDQPGEQVDVTFVVGPNSYGPYPPSRMDTGIISALTILRMTNEPEVF